ncbi:hypothetical protein CLAIMM_04504 [Cladophialophora immunda]|nr:hypothetical protein CLAIMM_04504 [Cladophialophora immunda]
MLLLTFLTLFVRLCNSGFVPPAEFCLPGSGLKELSGCIKWTRLRDECGGKDSEEAKLECLCTQEYLSSLYDCESDVQRCLASHRFDSSFQANIDEWHSQCDDRVNSTMTTPPLPTITQTYDFGACSRLYQSCLRGDYETRLCSDRYLPSSSLSYASCVCQPPVYSLFSECQYNGNISCKRTTAAESNIMGYSICSYFWSGSETLSSIDLTSYLGITGAGLAQATAFPSTRGWITKARSRPVVTPMATAPPLQVIEYGDSTKEKTKQQGLKF